MRRRPYTRRRKTVLGRIGTQERDQFSDATGRDRRVDRKCGRKAHSERDWFKILNRIVRHGFIQYRINNVVIRLKQHCEAISYAVFCLKKKKKTKEMFIHHRLS